MSDEQESKAEEAAVPQVVGEADAAPAARVKVEPRPPKDLDEAEVDALKSKAKELVVGLESGNNLPMVRSVQTLGSTAQLECADKLNLLQKPLRQRLERDDSDQTIPKTLAQLRGTLETINPHTLARPGPIRGFFLSILGSIPGLGKWLREGGAKKAASEIKARYEPAQKVVDDIMENLRRGKDDLLRDNSELDELFTQIQSEHLNVKKNAYLGELLLVELERYGDSAPEQEQSWVTDLTHKVAMRTQDLRTQEQVNEQFFANIRMTSDTNTELSLNVDRTIAVTRPLIMVAVAIQQALIRQKEVADATLKTQEYAGELLVNVAKQTGQQAKEVAEMQNRSVVALDKVKEAYDTVMKALDETDRTKREGIENAKRGLGQLNDMSEKLSARFKQYQKDTVTEEEVEETQA